MVAEKLSMRIWIAFWEIIAWIVFVGGPITALVVGLWRDFWWLLLVLGTFLGLVASVIVHVRFGAKLDQRLGLDIWGSARYAALATALWAGVLFTCWPFSQTRLVTYGWICLGIAALNAVFFFATSEGMKRSH